MTLILYVFASFGIAFALGYSKITLPFRSWLARVAGVDAQKKDEDPTTAAPVAEAQNQHSPLARFAARWLLALLECPVCVAFWIGLVSIATPIVDFVPVNVPPFALAPFLGFANMGAVLSLGLLTGLIGTETHN